MEVKKHLGRLELEADALAELLLQAYYALYDHSAASVGTSCLFCLCDFTTFHYFRLSRSGLTPLHLEQYWKVVCDQPPQAESYKNHISSLLEVFSTLV